MAATSTKPPSTIINGPYAAGVAKAGAIAASTVCSTSELYDCTCSVVMGAAV
jgi:hypothetical protein